MNRAARRKADRQAYQGFIDRCALVAGITAIVVAFLIVANL